MVALPTDVSRSGESAKVAVETVFQAIVSVLERSIANGRRRRTTAQATVALCVGSMVVAPALVNRALADELCDGVALTLEGWDKGTKSKKESSKRPQSLRVAGP
jgi:TetR/AcrR family transcriptional regulator, transcriptional repressor for nem operon